MVVGSAGKQTAYLAVLTQLPKVLRHTSTLPAGPSSSAGLSSPASPFCSSKAAALRARVEAFMAAHIMPAEPELDSHASSPERWTVHPLVEQLKSKVSALGSAWESVLLGAAQGKVK